MKKRTVYPLPDMGAKPFQGELMICVNCQRRQKSDPNVESGWTAISIDGTMLEYWCPKCFENLISRARHV